jgi:hypothetical protein
LEGEAVKKVLVMLIGVSFTSLGGAQDFLQQWRDSAIKGMQEFRDAHRAKIDARGWRFVGGAMNADAVPISDLFIKDVKIRDGPTRSAYVLNAFYALVAPSDLPEYQSTKALVWFDCNQQRYADRSIDRYASVDGSGDPTSSQAEKPASEPIEMNNAEPQSVEKTVLTAVCSAKP